MQYISLIDLTKELNLEKYESSGQLLALPSVINLPNFEDIKEFVLIQTKESNVFNGWIEQNPSLKELLITGTTNDFFKDSQNWKQHALFEKFKSYISPFFKELILRKKDAQISSEWAKIFSFFELMDDETRFYVEQSLYQTINSVIADKLHVTTTSIDESNFHQILLFLLSDENINIHNSLSRASHALKVAFIEQILRLFFHQQCKAKLAHWMILRLEKMELNKEQGESMESIKSKIKNGEIAFLKQEKNKRPSRLKNTTIFFSIAAIVCLLYYFYNKEYIAQIQTFKEVSSLSAFSIEERKEIDSLLKSMSVQQLDTFNNNYFSSGNSIIIQNPIKNKLASKIYSELEQDMTNHFMRLYDTQSILSSDKLTKEKINKTNFLSSINSKTEVEFKNDSEYTILILAWEESENGKVYSGIVSKKSTTKMFLLPTMKLILAPGNDYGPIPTKSKQDFSYLTNHFCSIDFNYESALSQIYSIEPTNGKLSKILLEGSLGEIISLTDSNGILN